MKNQTIARAGTAGFVILGIGAVVYLGVGARGGSGARTGEVPCILPSLPLVTHVHPKLTILVDGEGERVPSNIGLLPGCEKVLHTHEEGDGTIHVEAQDRRQYTLKDFFGVWGRSLARDGYTLVASAGDVEGANPETIALTDGLEITLSYTRNKSQ